MPMSVQNAAFVGRLEGRGVQVLRVVNKWDLIPHVPGAGLVTLCIAGTNAICIDLLVIIAVVCCRTHASVDSTCTVVLIQNPTGPATLDVALCAADTRAMVRAQA